MDLEVDHYSTEELIELLGLEVVTKDSIKAATEQKSTEYPSKKSVAFFKEIEKRLLEETTEDDVGKTIQVDVKRGTINPDLKTTITRLINIDSSYRDVDNLTNTTDQFIFELSEPLLNVISISLYSVEIPQSWYTFTLLKGTIGFIVCVVKDDAVKYPVVIDEGNYTTVSLYTEVQNKINNHPDLQTMLSVTPTYNANTGKLTLTFTPLDQDIFNVQLLWLDATGTIPSMLNNRNNGNLGWLLGYRIPIVTCQRILQDDETYTFVATATSLVDASGTKYIILSLEDYKTNRLNRSIVAVNNTPKTPIALPTYFSEDIPQYRTSPTGIHVLPSNPRNLTSKQLYTINAISDQILPQNRIIGHESSNAFAKIAVKRTDWAKTGAGGITETVDGVPGKLFVENGGPLALQMREYFGPVDLVNLSVALYDDKGNLLGLNGMEWSFSLIVKCIYQY
jgi:hypothetical protein